MVTVKPKRESTIGWIGTKYLRVSRVGRFKRVCIGGVIQGEGLLRDQECVLSHSRLKLRLQK